MDAARALADLTEISSQIQAAALIDSAGNVAASTLGDEARAGAFARAASDLVRAAETVRAVGGESLTQLEVATAEGSVFVVRDADRTIAATTSPEPTVGLVFYHLKRGLRRAADDQPAAETAPTATSADGEAADAEPAGAKPKSRPARRKKQAAEDEGGGDDES
jgi:predicted regulator of Ras-like GTPase activity (Roadblock/LC7/MglB family)